MIAAAAARRCALIPVPPPLSMRPLSAGQRLLHRGDWCHRVGRRTLCAAREGNPLPPSGPTPTADRQRRRTGEGRHMGRMTRERTGKTKPGRDGCASSPWSSSARRQLSPRACSRAVALRWPPHSITPGLRCSTAAGPTRAGRAEPPRRHRRTRLCRRARRRAHRRVPVLAGASRVPGADRSRLQIPGKFDTQPIGAGGGDCDIATGGGATPPTNNFDNLAVSSLSLANVTVNQSSDGGTTWHGPANVANPVSSLPLDDRQWQAADTGIGENY